MHLKHNKTIFSSRKKREQRHSIKDTALTYFLWIQVLSWIFFVFLLLWFIVCITKIHLKYHNNKKRSSFKYSIIEFCTGKINAIILIAGLQRGKLQFKFIDFSSIFKPGKLFNMRKIFFCFFLFPIPPFCLFLYIYINDSRFFMWSVYNLKRIFLCSWFSRDLLYKIYVYW